MPYLARRRACVVIVGAALGSACSRAPQVAPAFDYVRLDGSRASGADLRGKVVLVNFWATSCAVCVAEMPRFVDTHRRFAPRGFDTLAVAMSWDPPALVSDFAARRALPFTVAIDNTGAIARAFGDVKLTPTTFVIDRHGRVAGHWVGEPDFARLQVLIAELLDQA